MTTGLRERKRRRTHDTISAVAISLFLERGFDDVSVADIAEAAEVSKPTLFRYFPSKEDLVLHRIADHQGEAARIVRERGDVVEPIDALHRHFVDGLARRDPVTGLNDHPEVLAFHRMVFGTRALAARVVAYAEADEVALAEALAETASPGPVPVAAALHAAQIVAVQRVLARENWRQLIEGRAASDLYPDAVAAADYAFASLRE
ncbi:TetR family transcriptional regulator [Cryptosporangium minutisporangium]|uniref:TetR family transcriptional regulator n=1 Tax=Cryptosporangium minutisporangium TaxID=113569 RepID=A0ABP6SVP1_9ACTN